MPDEGSRTPPYTSIPFDLSDPDRAPWDVLAMVQTYLQAEMPDEPALAKMFARANDDLHGWPARPMLAELRRRLGGEFKCLTRTEASYSAWGESQLAEALKMRGELQTADPDVLRGTCPFRQPLPTDPDFKITLSDGTVIRADDDSEDEGQTIG